ncbi:MAG TPA: NAD-dependent epimerase/dehydratase family protein [Solirubrobacteraceae bacterium]|nr:NAD-dependent epimerase/dehydratase family protein [Solirubrobacteraceae bacterium]
MKVVVTGATGNVGTSLLARLQEDERVEEVVGLARRVPALSLPKVSWRRADVARSDLVALLRGADAVVHLAWLIQPSRDESATRRVNVDGSARVIDAVREAEVPALVYASSVGAYAPGPPDGRSVDESWPATGVRSSFYARHKAEVERLLDEFEERSPDTRVVRLRPGLCFKAPAATGIRRLFMGPLLPSPLLRREWLRVLPLPRGLRTQAVHSDDVGEAYRLALHHPRSATFNVAAEPVLDARTLSRALGARALELPPALVRAAADASWRLRLQPTSPGWLDMGMLTPVMDTSGAREQLGWTPGRRADEALLELLDGLRAGAEHATAPLQRATSGPLRIRELRSGVGATDGSERR